MPTIKTIQDFTAAVHTALASAFPECMVKVIDVSKNNGVHLTGLTIRPQNKNIAPTIHMEPYFAAFQSGQPLATVTDQIIKTCTYTLSCSNAGTDEGISIDFPHIKDKICYKLVGMDKNSELLSTVPHRDFLDLAIVYYIHLSSTDNVVATINITDSLAHAWGADEETLYNLARTNTPALNRGCVAPMLDTIDSIMGIHQTHNRATRSYEGFNFTYTDSGLFPMYVATNQSKAYGACILLYDGFLDAVAEKFGSFYILPSSIHELIIVPAKPGIASDLKQMVNEINGTETSAEDVLSGSCYYYDAETRQLKIAA